ncbi:MAG: DEAD/DEAH box helicase [Lentisphaeria bacterium]|nr:DEAD/DEAH box helicase [Lentisphaeria bacterium]
MRNFTWLDSWPTVEEVNGIFPMGIRSLFRRNANRFILSSVTWLEDGASIYVDQYKCSWKLVGTQWQRSCSCGVLDGKCPHLYALASKVHDEYGDLLKNRSSKKTTVKSKQSTSKTSDAHQLTFETKLNPRTASTSRAKRVTRGLVVEADFKTTVGFALIRFYLVQAGKRRILKLSELRNHCAVAGYNSVRGEAWGEDDRSFMKWLGLRFDPKKSREYTKLTALKLTRQQFDGWLVHWQENLPARFIERDTQEVICNSDGLIKLRFELSIEDDRTTISAVARFGNGQKCFFYELVREMERQKLPTEKVLNLEREYLFKGVIGRVDYPIEPKTIWELFHKKNPSMKTEFVCEHFPCLIEERLDLVGGPAVVCEEESAELILSASAYKEGLIFKALLNGSPVGKSENLTFDGSKFIIHRYHAEHLDDVAFFLENLGGNAAQAVVQLESRNLSLVCQLWDEIPDEVTKTCDDVAELALHAQVDGDVKINASASDQWVDLTTSWHIADDSIYTENINSALVRQDEFVRTKEGHWVRLDLAAITSKYNALKDSGFVFSSQRVIASEAVKLFEDKSSRLIFTPDAVENLVFVKQSLREVVTLPSYFEDILRPYQKEGFKFLQHMSQYGIGCILADDMGLGKTIQILALLVANRQVSDKASLVCAPASVLHVWENEMKKFAPELRAVVCHGAQVKREKIISNIDQYDLIITSYGAARNDVALLREYAFDSILLDEAQFIRNPKTKAYQAIRTLKGRMRIAISGTPVENRATDLWSLVNFTNPGLIGTLPAFKKSYEGEGNIEARAKLASRVAPLILRRTKEVVAKDLPAKTVETMRVDLSPEQEALYQAELGKLAQLKQEGGNNSIQLLASLTKLRQICDSPKLLGVDAPSPKLESMIDMLKTIMSEGHSALVFSTFTTMLDVIKERLVEEGISNLMLTGKTAISKRQELVRSFNESEAEEVFLLSLKAAGTGLTLTKADYVFIFDPWWNPAAEAQAIDRTHRIGQTKPVIAYKMVATNSLEEQILELQGQKQELFDELINEQSNVKKNLTNELLDRMLEANL